MSDVATATVTYRCDLYTSRELCYTDSERLIVFKIKKNKWTEADYNSFVISLRTLSENSEGRTEHVIIDLLQLGSGLVNPIVKIMLAKHNTVNMSCFASFSVVTKSKLLSKSIGAVVAFMHTSDIVSVFTDMDTALSFQVSRIEYLKNLPE
jgi:hypothetical protein